MNIRYFCLLGLGAGLLSMSSANLFRNASFEAIPGYDNNQGIMPLDWIQTSGVLPGADTWSNDASYGLQAGTYGHFDGCTAYDGIRWVAGLGSYYRESFGQVLTAPLVAGKTYEVSAFLHASLRYIAAGGYDVKLRNDEGDVLVGTLNAPSSKFADGWQFVTCEFVAPGAYQTLVFDPFGGPGGSYFGVDDVSLEVQSVPEPTTIAVLGLGLLSAVRLRRRRS